MSRDKMCAHGNDADKCWTCELDSKGSFAAPAGSVAYGVIDPDYARIYTVIRCLAWQEGYAAMMHGSFTRDLDIVAVPWTEKACEPEHLVRRVLASNLNLSEANGNPGSKPHSRRVWTLMLPEFGDPRFVDLSICQPQNKPMMDITPEESARMAAVTGTPETQREMPRYQCHKKVWALKIADVKEVGRRAPNGELVEIVKELSFEDSGFVPIRVDARWYDKHRPTPGGYYVRYEDGYESYSPAKAFEDGYTRIH